MEKADRKNQCTCKTGTPCCVHEPEKACTCGTGEPCCVHEASKEKQAQSKMYGGCCEPGCGPGICK